MIPPPIVTTSRVVKHIVKQAAADTKDEEGKTDLKDEV
jgi:hypothetical protein